MALLGEERGLRGQSEIVLVVSGTSNEIYGLCSMVHSNLQARVGSGSAPWIKGDYRYRDRLKAVVRTTSCRAHRKVPISKSMRNDQNADQRA